MKRRTWTGLVACLQVPLYPAAVVWRQLVNEEKSRINACKGVRACVHHWRNRHAVLESLLQLMQANSVMCCI